VALTKMALLKTKTGGARIEVIFAAVALVVVLGMSVFLLAAPPAPQQTAPARDPAEIALTQLMSGEIQQFTASQTRVRLNTYIDPTDRTDAQLRNAHRTWAERIGDPRYNDPALANDMFHIIDHAMRIRGVRPHPGF
jgi:hypothetical protein